METEKGWISNALSNLVKKVPNAFLLVLLFGSYDLSILNPYLAIEGVPGQVALINLLRLGVLI